MLVGAYSFDVRRGEVEANLAAVTSGLREAAEQECALVVLPEMWTTSFAKWTSADDARDLLAKSDAALERVAALSKELSLVVAGTTPAPNADALPFNRLTIFAGGMRVLEYDKVHLFSPTAEEVSFSAGVAAPLCVPSESTGLPPMSGEVCYDLRFSEVMRPAVRAGAQLLVVPAQWPIPRATHWRTLLLARAVEHQCVMIGCNRTGIELIGRNERELHFPGNSMIVDPHGKVLAEGAGESGLITAEVDFDVVRKIRVRVPVEKDRRDDLYANW